MNSTSFVINIEEFLNNKDSFDDYVRDGDFVNYSQINWNLNLEKKQVKNFSQLLSVVLNSINKMNNEIIGKINPSYINKSIYDWKNERLNNELLIKLNKF